MAIDQTQPDDPYNTYDPNAVNAVFHPSYPNPLGGTTPTQPYVNGQPVAPTSVSWTGSIGPNSPTLPPGSPLPYVNQSQVNAHLAAAAPSGTMPSGMDPRIWALFQKYGKTPTGSGTGVTDWNYWQTTALQNAGGDWNYVLGRLESDLAGNGPDQGGGGSASSSVAPQASVQPSPFQSQVRDLLLQQLGKAASPVDENAPEIAQPFAAANLQAQRGLQTTRQALAERLYAQNGGNPQASNALDQGVTQANEQMAGNLAGIKSQLIQGVYQQKAQQLQQDLQLAMQSGDAEAVRQVQVALANLQNAYQYMAEGDQYGINLAQLQLAGNQNATNAVLGY